MITPTPSNDPSHPASSPPDRRSRWSTGVRVLVALVVLIGGALACAALVATAPETKPADPDRPLRIVQTVEIAARTESIRVTAYGTVIPAREVTVQAQVGGRIVAHHPELVPGGRIAADEELVRIDPADFELAVATRKAALEEAKFELDLEKGRQVVASREWELLEDDLPDAQTNRSLVLREPHLRRTEALVEQAENAIARATLDLSRTTINAPFNAIVLQESIEESQLVDVGGTIARLAGADEFWVRVSVPVSQLRWIRLPEGDRPGAVADVILETSGDEVVHRRGHVVRLLGELETSGRMARLLVSIEDPLGLDDSSGGLPLLLGSYVRVEIEAGDLEDVYAIERSSLRDGDRIWLVGPSGELEIRPAEVLWTERERILISSRVGPEERLVVSDLRVALPRMKVDPRPVRAGTTGETTDEDESIGADGDEDDGTQATASRSGDPGGAR